MDAETFVRELEAITPTREQLVGRGVPFELAERISLGNGIVKRVRQVSTGIAPLRDHLVTLISCYDVSRTEVGAVRFLDAPVRIDVTVGAAMWGVARLDADYIALEPKTRRVALVEAGEFARELRPVARSSGEFLDALIFAARAGYGGTQIGAGAECARLAGLPEAVDFWETIAE